jgi:dienelactone hydrolase
MKHLTILLATAALAALSGCGNSAAVPAPVVADSAASVATKSETIEYTDGTTTFEGYLAYPEGSAKRPGIVVFHDWMGLGPNPKKRADELAKLGYVALAADLYGKGIRPKNPAEAMKLVGQYKGDRPAMRTRAKAALDKLVATGKVDAAKTASIGYCFGGTAALELARSGAPLAGTVSFHGGLDTPNPADGKNVKGRVLVLHGADDPHVLPAEVAAFEDEMRQAHVDWQLVAYGNAVHAFTIEEAGTDNSKGAAYNKDADRRSWIAMRDFFGELWPAQ